MLKNLQRILICKYQTPHINLTTHRFIDTDAILPIAKYENSLSTNYNMGMLKNNRSLNTKKPYKPPLNVRSIIEDIVKSVSGISKDLDNFKLDERKLKFHVLSTAISHFDHDIPNCILSADIKTVGDLIQYFETEVTETSSYEDLHAKAPDQLPQNLHVQLEALRFDPETDVMFGGKTAFPGRDTIVTSLKYKRKYKGSIGTKDTPGYHNQFKTY